MDIAEVLEEYRTLRPLSPGAEYLMRRTVALYGLWLARTPTLADLDDLTVSRWLEWLGQRQKAWTVAGHRTRLLSLWRLAERRHGIAGPGEVRRVRKPPPMPRAWSLDQVRALLAATRHLNARAAAWFHALILTAYESGLRKSDLERITKADVDAGGTLLVRQHKTLEPHVVTIRPETAAEILGLPGETPLRSPWCVGRTQEYWSRLRTWAELRSGGLHQLRRTGATLIAAEYGTDAAREWLGHRSPEMVEFYLDRRFSGPRRLPPPISDLQSRP